MGFFLSQANTTYLSLYNSREEVSEPKRKKRLATTTVVLDKDETHNADSDPLTTTSQVRS